MAHHGSDTLSSLFFNEGIFYIRFNPIVEQHSDEQSTGIQPESAEMENLDQRHVSHLPSFLHMSWFDQSAMSQSARDKYLSPRAMKSSIILNFIQSQQDRGLSVVEIFLTRNVCRENQMLIYQLVQYTI